MVRSSSSDFLPHSSVSVGTFLKKRRRTPDNQASVYLFICQPSLMLSRSRSVCCGGVWAVKNDWSTSHWIKAVSPLRQIVKWRRLHTLIILPSLLIHLKEFTFFTLWMCSGLCLDQTCKYSLEPQQFKGQEQISRTFLMKVSLELYFIYFKGIPSGLLIMIVMSLIKKPVPLFQLKTWEASKLNGRFEIAQKWSEWLFNAFF